LLAIVLSGDGGWRDLDKTISEKLQSAGVSVVGWDSLRYFWSRKSPDHVASDLGAIVDTFLSRWGGSKVVLVGYSFGADVLPFACDRLSPETKAHIVQLSLLGSRQPISKSVSQDWLALVLARKRCQPSRRSRRSIRA
jgi:type IV secretory pathway VirJ component